MKKTKKIIIISISVILLIFLLIFFAYKIFKDENSLNISEKTWINNNKNSVFTINIPNDINIFGKSGEGVFFDFINNIEEEYNLKLNSTVYSISNANDSLGFNVANTYDNRDLLIYTDYYVLISKDDVSISSLDKISDKSLGVLSNDLSYVSKYYKLPSNIKTFDSSEELFNSFDKVDLIIVPLNQYKDKIVTNQYNICYFFNDAKIYYYIHLGSDKTLNSIITKYYNNWMIEDYMDSYNEHNYNLFKKELNINEIDEDKISNKEYVYEYLINYPYDFNYRGDLTGIVNEYLDLFDDFSDIDFKYKKVRKLSVLEKDIENNKVDLYFDLYNLDNNYLKSNINFNIEYYLISNKDNYINLDSLNSYNGTVYVEENTMLFNYLKKYNNITIKTFTKDSKIKKLLKKGNLVLVDKLEYDNYLKDNLENSQILLNDFAIQYSYRFMLNSKNKLFNTLFQSYVNTINPKEIINSGLVKYDKSYNSSKKAYSFARFIILLVTVSGLFIFFYVRNKKKIVLNTKIKNNEKIRYVDMLTCLKNRNYLNDRMDVWNQNTVYPQCVIVLDLNNIKYLNDTFGHEEGDKQIKAVANILFKTQLENTELLRTDGNEFMVYLVGYNEKKIVNYIKKLMKEFKKLPYEYGVAIGFSMIKDDLKLIEDAFNEATILMRKNKEAFKDYNEK